MVLLRQLIRFSYLLIIMCCSTTVSAQLCTGSLGDPVVNITFGRGTNPGPPLASTLTNYNFQRTECPDDGNYTITNRTTDCFGASWHTLASDHTGDPQGYFMLVNASFQPSDFYVETVNGLCSNTTFEFSAWLMNILKNPQGIRPDITFRIEKLDGELLSSFNTGEILVSSSPTWKKYGFFFTTPPGVSSVVIRMRNNAPGGNGNDICLDDIQFRPCGAKLEATIGNTDEINMSLCEGTRTNLTLSSAVSLGYIFPAFQWQLNLNNEGWKDIAGANSASLNVSLIDKGRYEYRVMVAEEGNMSVLNCRVASNLVTLEVKDRPTINISDVADVCEGSQLLIDADINFKAPSNWAANWKRPSTSPSMHHLENDAATNTAVSTLVLERAQLIDSGYYYLTATNANGCSITDSVNVHLLPKPIASFDVSTPLCSGQEVELLGQGLVLAPAVIRDWDWSLGNGSRSGVQRATASYPSGVFTASLAVTASNGCVSDTVDRILTINPNPVVNFGLPEVCLSDPFAEFTDSTTISDGSENSFKYLWVFNDPAANANNPNTSPLKNPRHRYTSTGVYNVRLEVTSGNQCVSDTTIPFTVNGSVPKAQFQLMQGASRYCSEQPLIITDASSVDFGNITHVEIYWDYQNDPLLKTTDEHPTYGKVYPFVYGNNIRQDGEQRTIRYVAYSGINCVSETNQTVTIYQSPSVQFTGMTPICEEAEPFSVSAVTESTGVMGNGSFSGPGITADGMFSPLVAGDGRHTLTYEYVSSFGCKDSAQQIIVVYPQPQVNAGPDRTLIIGGVITIDANAEGNGLKYAWSPTERINNVNVLKPVVSPITETTYTLNVTSDMGCSNSDEVLVKVFEYLVIPNAFTPNGDGKNDTWRVPYLESYPDFQLVVYNRYGQIVYRSQRGLVDWDGRMNGKEAPTGTYVYVLDRKQFGGIMKGTFQLIR